MRRQTVYIYKKKKKLSIFPASLRADDGGQVWTFHKDTRKKKKKKKITFYMFFSKRHTLSRNSQRLSLI